MKLFICLVILLSFVSCQKTKNSVNKSVTIQSGVYASDISSLIDDNNRLQQDLAEETIMTSATGDQVNLFRVFLIQSRRSLIALLDNPKSEKALKDLENLVFNAQSLIITVSDQSYITPYIKSLDELIKSLYLYQGGMAENYLIKFPFNEANSGLLIRDKDEMAADFVSRENEVGPYLGVDSFRAKNSGTTFVITPMITLQALKYFVRFEYLVRFYSDDARQEKLIKFYVGENKESIEEIEWVDLLVEVAPDAGSFTDPASISGNIELNLINTDIRFKVEYRSDAEANFFPAFNLYNLEVLENQ